MGQRCLREILPKHYEWVGLSVNGSRKLTRFKVVHSMTAYAVSGLAITTINSRAITKRVATIQKCSKSVVELYSEMPL